MKKLLVIGFLLVLFLTGCTSPSADVIHAEAVDWVWGVEELRSGAVRLWLRHDDIAGYCTSDAGLASKAKELTGQLVEVTFETVHYDDKESWRSTGCARLITGVETSTPIFRLTGIERWHDDG